MSYVPIVIPPTMPQPPSPRTRELAEILGQVLDEYQKAHPSVTGAEMREAIQIAKSATGGNKSPVALILSLGIALVLMATVLGLVFLRSGGDIELGSSMPMVVLGIIVFVFIGVVGVVVKASSRCS